MYQLDAAAATKADTIGAYLQDTGKYIGVFTRAEALVSTNKGTHGVGFTFKAEDGRETKFDIWTKKGNGEPLTGRIVILRWDSMEQLMAWRHSPEYEKARKIGEKYAKYNLTAVDGVKP